MKTKILTNLDIVLKPFIACLLLVVAVLFIFSPNAYAQTSKTGSIGLEGTISTPPPDTAATITVPSGGQVFEDIPITVSGLCKGDVLVKLFKNNVFAGSAQCVDGSYSIQVDLFVGINELIARVYDALDQVGPDSATVTVTFSPPTISTVPRPTLASTFAKRGANPGQILTWPITLSGGIGPYAVTVDWGDGSVEDLFSQTFPGTFNIEHAYDNPGSYNIVIKASDSNDQTAFLQLVAISNGALSQDYEDVAGAAVEVGGYKVLWQPMAISIPLIGSTFWLGSRYELKKMRIKVKHGERPF